MRRLGLMAAGVTLAATLLTVGLSNPASAAPIAAAVPAASVASTDHHGAVFVNTHVRGPGATAPQPAKGVSPNGCQGTISTLTLETLSRGNNYDCSGYYTNAAGQTAYYLFTGNWSGILYTYTGSTEYDYYYCDGASIPIGYHTVIGIWLSPTRTSWC